MKRILTSYIGFAIRRPFAIVGPYAAVAAAAAAWLILASPLQLDMSFLALLPEDMACVVAAKKTSDRMGSTDQLIVAVQSPVVEDNAAFLDALAPKLEALEEISTVSLGEDKEYFRKHKLLYMDTADLEDIVARAQARVDYEKKVANPFYVSLDDERPPDIDFDDLMKKYEARFALRGGKGIIDGAKEEAKAEEAKAEEAMAEDAAGKGAAKIDLRDRFESDDGRIMSLTARPVEPSSDIEFCRRIIEKVQRLIDETGPTRNPEMIVDIGGAYRNRVRSYEGVVDDIFSSLGISLGLILLIIVASFRKIRAVGLIFIPLLVGVLLTVGLVALTLGHLNIVTALIFAVLLGLGIDFGVHFSLRYLDERTHGATLARALELAIVKTGRAIVVAGATTAGGLAVLVLARFKGFSEFGLIAMMGIAMCLLVYLMLFPALVVVFERIRPQRVEAGREGGRPVHISTVGPAVARYAIGLAVVVIVTVASAILLPRVSFEYDFHNLTAKGVSSGLKYGKSIGGRSSSVVAILETQEEAKALTRQLEEKVDASGEIRAMVRRIYSLSSFIPDDQPPKLELLGKLREHVDEALRLKKLKKKTRARLEEIRELTLAEEITPKTLPAWLVEKFEEKDGTLGRIVFIVPDVDEMVITEMERFYDEFGAIETAGGETVHPSASGFVMVEIVRAVQRDGIYMLIAATAVVMLLLFAELRSVKKTVIVFVPQVIGLLWIAGAMVALDLKLGIYNMLVLPMILGIGIDTSIHLFHSYDEHGPGSIRHVLATAGKGAVVAAATTGVGFIGMMTVTHMGLRSIGNLAITSILICLVGTMASLLLFFGFMEALRAAKAKDAGDGSSSTGG